MTHPEDDEHDIADHGTVIMDRKAASGIPRSKANPSISRPSPPPIVPAAGLPATSMAQAPIMGPNGLPVLPPSISGVPIARHAGSSPHKRMAFIVAFGSFTIVFVLGALIMLMVRLARDAADDGPRPNTPAATK